MKRPEYNSLPLDALFQAMMSEEELLRIIDSMLAEDLGDDGDVTSESMELGSRTAMGDIVSRESGVIAGIPMVMAIIERADATIRVEASISDGDRCSPGQPIMSFSGELADILMLERSMLNILGQLSAVATMTRSFVDAVSGTSACICDTRKTIPGIRRLQKYAVRCGGGLMHRIGLFDAVLVKDNHLKAVPPDQLAGGIARIAAQAREKFQPSFIEVEVDDLEQLQQVLELEPGVVDIVLLDNMEPATMRKAVSMRDAAACSPAFEASGGITLETVRDVAMTGVERIAIGALTHSSGCLDIGLDVRDE